MLLYINILTVIRRINFLASVIVFDVFSLKQIYNIQDRYMPYDCNLLRSQSAERLSYTTQHKQD
jgi:hypothetical protein